MKKRKRLGKAKAKRHTAKARGVFKHQPTVDGKRCQCCWFGWPCPVEQRLLDLLAECGPVAIVTEYDKLLDKVWPGVFS